MKGYFACLYCVILIGCAGNDTSNEIYDEGSYKLVDSIDFSAKGYQVFISKNDTSRKLLKYFWPNGKLQMVAYYHNGHRDGVWRIFMDDGVPLSVTKYLNDKKDGKTVTYHSNGKVATVEMFHKGKAIGTWYYYNDLGKLIKTENYK
jgi:antitoxin component YwqK of YwqJK toxin-antitoxin module